MHVNGYEVHAVSTVLGLTVRSLNNKSDHDTPLSKPSTGFLQ